MTTEDILNYTKTTYSNSIETSLAIVGIREDKIIEIKFKLDDYDVELSDQMEIHDALGKLTDDGKISFSVIVIPGLYGSITKEARDMEMFSKDTFKNLISLAIVVHALHQRILATFYIKFKNTKPIYPTKIFDNEKKGIDWSLLQMSA